MNPVQLNGDSSENNRLESAQNQAKMWTAIPGIIQSINMEHMTCEVQPAIMAKQFSRNDASVDVQLPLLVDCPVQFPYGGHANITFPVIPGDECLVVFSSRCIDSWWQSGGVQVQAEVRMHDLSDGFVLLGFRAVPNVIPNISTTDIQIRNDAGDTYIGLNPNTQVITIVTPTDINIQCDKANINCDTSATLTTPNATINATTQINGDTTIQGNLTVTSNVNVGGNETIANDLYVGGTSNV